MAILDPIEYKSLQSGLITESAVSKHRMPLDAVTESVNFHFDQIGSATLRQGSTLVGSALGGSCLGLYEFRDNGGNYSQLIQVNGTVAYYLAGGMWTSKRTGLAASAKARFTTFLNVIFMVNGSDAMATWTGNPSDSFITNGNALNAPTSKFIESFRTRVWTAGNATYPDRLYYSSLPSSVTTPVITWDTDVATGQWIDINPSDGEGITALKRTKNSLLVFKNNHIYRVYSIEQTEPDPKIQVGTYNSESVVETKDGIYFHHPTGFYKYDYVWSTVTELSKPIIDIVKNITVPNYSKICGWVDTTGDHILWSVGQVTYNGITYTNLVVRYTISTQTWTHYQYPAQFLFSSTYNDGTTLFMVSGDASGNIVKMDTGLTDNGSKISYSLIHRWFNLDGLLSTRKNVTRMLFSHDGGAGSNVSYQSENPTLNDWKPIVQLKNYDTLKSSVNINSREMRFRVSGQSNGQPFRYYGFEVIGADSKLIQLPQ